MSTRPSATWYLAYFPSGVAFGILSVLVPLYFVERLGGSLLDLGVMTSAATIILIPASVYLGRLPDRYGRSKPFILASYLTTGTLLFLISTTRSVPSFQALYVSMNLANYLVGPSTTVLIAESYERSSWGRAMAKRSFMEGLAQALGLGICTLTIGYLGYEILLGVAPPLVFASLLITFFAVRDPPIHVERFLARVESPVEDLEALSFHLTNRGGISRPRRGSLRLGEEPRMGLFGIGLTLFTFAASNAFTSLPIYLRDRAAFPPSVVFGIFFARSLVSTFSYLVVSSLLAESGGWAVKTAAATRAVLIGLLLVIPTLVKPFSILLALVLLSSIAFSWSLYSLGTEVVTVRHAAPGHLGVYDALSSLGSSAGGLIGGAIPAMIGFEPLFVTSTLLFISALLSFIASRI